MKVIAFDVNEDVLCNNPITIKPKDLTFFLLMIAEYSDQYYEDDDNNLKCYVLNTEIFNKIKVIM